MRNNPDNDATPYGATCDNQGNCIVWMRPDVLGKASSPYMKAYKTL